MKTIEHLTKEQLAAYAAHSPLAQTEADEIGKHLLQCAICRDAMPVPTTEQFWSALLDETEFDENFEAEKISPARSPFPAVFAFFRQPLAWGTLALLFVAGISFLIWRGASEQPNSSNEVVQTVETPKTENKLPTNENSSVPTGVEAGNSNSLEGNTQPQPRLKQPQSNLPAVAENTKNPEETEDRDLAQLSENTPPAVFSLRPNGQTILRGGDDKQNSNPAAVTFALLAPVGETVLESAPDFRWEKLPNAKSYRISIFDEQFNEVLTAEVSVNSFKPGKPLKAGAKYLWRVAAQTANGEVVAPLPPQPPAMFRVARKSAGSRIEFLKKNKSDRVKLAGFYAEEGMLENARCTLTEILSKNPNDKSARRLLVRVEQWQKENQPAVQRCATPPISTKEAQ